MRTSRIPARRRIRSERGNTLVEFALASALFLTMIFGILEFSLAVWRHNMVSHLAQEGARWASVHGRDSTTPKSAADVQTYIDGLALGLTVTVTTTPVPSTLTAGQTVTVAVSNVYTPLTGLLPANAMTLSNTAKMIVAR